MVVKRVLTSAGLLLALLLLGGSFATAQAPQEEDGTPSLTGSIGAQDEVIGDDLIVLDSICTGFDCANGEVFGSDTLILKENNLRIYFNDTSASAAFPSNDWRIAINDTTNGGQSYFRIEDVTHGTSPFTIQADGNVGIGTTSPTERLHVAGNLRVDGSISEASDVNLKENFEPVDSDDVLERLAAVPITTWNYKADSPAVRHIGPMAQDFSAAFGVGPDDRHIAPLDANGVALAAIQALNQRIEEQDTQIADLQRENAALESRLAALEALVTGEAAR
jgi:hypothetical protein